MGCSHISGSSKHSPDSIQAYFAESIVPSHLITEAGGYMKYWYQAQDNRPSLSKMAQAYCSAPG